MVVVLVAMVASIVARTGSPWTLPLVTMLAVPATSRRLTTIGLPRWPAALVAVPPIAPLVVALLLVGAGSTETRASRAEDAQARVKAAGIAIATTVGIALSFVFLSANVMHSYGWALFVTLPFVLGLVATVAYAAHGRRSLGDALEITVLSFTAVSLALLLSALEGAICIVMAAPLALVVGLAGATTAHLLIRAHLGGPRLMCAAILAVPTLLAGESTRPQAPPLTKVTTSVVVDAAPRVVWRHVIAFRDIPAPRDRMFLLGVAHPIGASIEGTGVGAVRRCRFSTGDFVEPITVWDPPRRLTFSVARQPAPMKELSPYAHVHAPHLDGFLRSERGEFRLMRLPGHRTLLVGTTWYRNRMWPASYWRVWSDGIIHRIHRRVLEHVRAEAEARTSVGPA